ncbi:MAG: DUF47 family protein [Methanoregulaceae archaeon]|nr:DUF47 family protein [Methanoregulaceae archaeon]
MIHRSSVGLKEWIIPQDQVFFDLFDRLAAVVVLASYRLVNIMDNFDTLNEAVVQMKQLEHDGDKITHEIYEQLNKSFITPLQPEEISHLAGRLDDILDYMDSSTRKMYNYEIPGVDSYMMELAKLIQISAVEIEEAVKGIRSIKDPMVIERRCIEVNRLENLADDVLAHATKELFKTKNAVDIIKYKDIYEYLEIATDKCEDVANILSDIAIRHS